MSDLKRRYRRALNSRIEALERALKELESGSAEAEPAIRRIAHSLAGSGGSYGFPEVSDAAFGIEDAEAADLPAMVEELLRVLRRTAAGSGTGAAMEILVVDDDPEMSHLLKHILAGEGRDISIAASGGEAEKILAERRPDLVLLDLILPDADGRNLLMRIRERAATAQVPVIVLSGKTSAMARSECFALGADDFLVKPFDPQEVHDTVHRHLAKGSTVDEGLPAAGAAIDESDPAVAVEGFKDLQDRSIDFSLLLVRIQLLESPEEEDSIEARSGITNRVMDAVRPRLRVDEVLSRWSATEIVSLLVGSDGDRAGEILGPLNVALESGELTGSTPGVQFEILSGVYPVAEDDTLQKAFSGARARLSSSAMISEKARRAEAVLESLHLPILLAEDDDLTASLVEHRLARAGHEVVHHRDGRKAWEAVRQGGFSLVILDVKLPGMEGFEILEKIRSNPPSADIPVIILTAMGREEDVVRAFDLGADDYVLKPFSPVELIARARRLIREAQDDPSPTARSRRFQDLD